MIGKEKTKFEKKSELRQHYRDHLLVKYKCGYCNYNDRLRKPILCHIWESHQGQTEQIDSTELHSLLNSMPNGSVPLLWK